MISVEHVAPRGGRSRIMQVKSDCEEEKIRACPSLESMRTGLEKLKKNRKDPVRGRVIASVNEAYDCASKKRSLGCLEVIREALAELQDEGQEARKSEDE